MVVLTAILLIAGGIFASAPLFKRVAKGLEKLFIVLGFIVGIAVIIATIDLALNLQILSSILGTAPATDAFPYAQYTLVVMAVLGILLFSRPLRNVRWASLIALGAGILAAAYLHIVFPSFFNSTLALGIVFIITILIVYTLLRFVEDILEFIGTVLAFPPIAIIIGLVSIYYGIMIYGL